MTEQRIASIVRQVLAVLVTIYGILSATQSALHLPVAVSTALVAFGPVILTVEHYLSDPSTGTTPAPSPVPDPAPLPASSTPSAPAPVQIDVPAPEPTVIAPPSPAPVPPSWSQMTTTPDTHVPVNPAPPAPAA